MQPCKPIEAARWILLCGAFALLPAQAAAPANAPPRHRVCAPCAMPMLPVALPRKGLVFTLEWVHSSVSHWYVVDLERGEASRFLARAYADHGQPRLAIIEQATRAIPSHELNRLQQIDREIWALEDRLPEQGSPDGAWRLWLLDGGDVRHELRLGEPNGPSAEIYRMLERVLERPTPAE
jgi:hypothetical protein